MDRRLLKPVLDVLLVLVGALLGIATNYATGETAHVPLALRLLREWSVPLVGLGLAALVAGQIWLHLLDRPVPPPRVWDSEQPPYPGLEAFTEHDAAVFFGRDREIAELVERLHPAVPARAHRFVTVVGPSGSGKSSLVRAGLLPALARRRGRWATGPVLQPGTDPVAGLVRGLAGLDAARPALLVVDQLEELLTLSGPDERAAFLAAVRDALAADPRLWIVATLRSDFLTDLLDSGFADLIRQPSVVGVLGRDQLREVIARPAEQAGLGFGPGVVPRMVDDCGGGDALPLLAYTLQELYLRAGGSGGTVTEASYRALGGVAGALSERADRIAAELADAPVIPTLLKFVTVDRDAPTRRRVPRTDLSPAEQEVADAFVAGRLLTGDGGVLDVAHEALFRQWPPLRQAVEARAEDLRRRTELERWAQDWAYADRADAYLLTGERLDMARQWLAEDGSVPLVVEFVRRSGRKDRAALARAADAVAVRVLESASREPELALLAALTAVTECGATPSAVQALRTAMAASRLVAVERGFGLGATAVAWSPDGRRLAATSDDGTVRVWDPTGEAAPVVLTGGGGWIFDVAWSPDGRRLAAGSRAGTLLVWDAVTWAELAVLRHGEAVHDRDKGVGGIAWSPDGSSLASAGNDRAVRVWDGDTFAEVTALHGHEGTVWGLDWSPDGQRIATSGEDATVRIWDPVAGTALRTVTGHLDIVADVAWSPDGEFLASASDDRTVRLWDTLTWTEAHKFTGMDHYDRVAWSPDGKRLAASDEDRTARVWSIGPGARMIWLTGHTDSVYGVDWSPDGRLLATASRDRTVAIWDVNAHPNSLTGHTDSVWHAAWSPDGTRIASASQDGSVRVWDADHGRCLWLKDLNGEVADVAWAPDGTRLVAAMRDGTAVVLGAGAADPLMTITGHTEEISNIAWSPDGTRIATAARDSTTRVWDAATGDALHVLHGHGDWIGGVAWSPDSRHLATCSTDRTAIVWDATTGAAVTTLRGHTDYAWKVCWSPDGRRLVTGSRDRTLRLWDPFAGTQLAVLTGHEDRVQGVAWSPDGTRIASVSRDRTVRLWDPGAAAQIAVLGVHDDWVNGLSWSPDGTRLTTASRDRTVRIWEPAHGDLDALLRRARSRVFRELTADERRAYLLPDPPDPQDHE